MGYSPWGRKESDMTERLHFLSFFSPLPYNPSTSILICQQQDLKPPAQREGIFPHVLSGRERNRLGHRWGANRHAPSVDWTSSCVHILQLTHTPCGSKCRPFGEWGGRGRSSASRHDERLSKEQMRLPVAGHTDSH